MRQKLAAGQGELDLNLDAPPEAGGPLPIASSRMGHLWDALSYAYDVVVNGMVGNAQRR